LISQLRLANASNAMDSNFRCYVSLKTKGDTVLKLDCRPLKGCFELNLLLPGRQQKFI